MVAAHARCAIAFCLSPGQAGDAPEGRELLRGMKPLPDGCRLIMDRAYEGNETRQLALDLGFIPVVPPLCTRVEPWQYDKAMYKRRNEIECTISRNGPARFRVNGPTLHGLPAEPRFESSTRPFSLRQVFWL